MNQCLSFLFSAILLNTTCSTAKSNGKCSDETMLWTELPSISFVFDCFFVLPIRIGSQRQFTLQFCHFSWADKNFTFSFCQTLLAWRRRKQMKEIRIWPSVCKSYISLCTKTIIIHHFQITKLHTNLSRRTILTAAPQELPLILPWKVLVSTKFSFWH